MKIINTVADMRALRMLWQHKKQRVAFVPTMGNLHRGHLDLVRHAKANADVVVVSIFVNPLQFGANEDLDKYPRTFAGDCEALQALNVDAVFAPTPEVMYPKGLEQQTFVEVPGISSIICGASRPGHFRGVATVVCKLFNMVMPDEAFFGEKDFQQLQVIRQMVEDLDLPVNVNGIATVRDPDGLALSSRNQYLTTQERQKATAIYQCLLQMTTALAEQNGQISELVTLHKASLANHGFVVDYLEVRNANTLQDFSREDNQGVVLIAAYLGKTRLIDNLCFTVASKD